MRDEKPSARCLKSLEESRGVIDDTMVVFRRQGGKPLDDIVSF
jgi:hypothetical protein